MLAMRRSPDKLIRITSTIYLDVALGIGSIARYDHDKANSQTFALLTTTNSRYMLFS